VAVAGKYLGQVAVVDYLCTMECGAESALR